MRTANERLAVLGAVLLGVLPVVGDAATSVTAASRTARPGAHLFGTRHTPNNRPISDWEADIRRHYSLPATASRSRAKSSHP